MFLLFNKTIKPLEDKTIQKKSLFLGLLPTTFLPFLSVYLPKFGSKMAHLPQPGIFYRKTIDLSFMYLLAPLIVPNKKKFFEWIPSHEVTSFSGVEWPIYPK